MTSLTAPRAASARRELSSRFAGVCRDCRRAFPAGTVVWWAPGEGAQCPDCHAGRPVQGELPVAPAPVAPVARAQRDLEPLAELGYDALEAEKEVLLGWLNDRDGLRAGERQKCLQALSAIDAEWDARAGRTTPAPAPVAQPAPAPAPVAPKAPAAVLSEGINLDKGYFTAVLADGSHVTLRVRPHWEADKAKAGERVIAYLSGSDNEHDYTGCAFLGANGQARLYQRLQGNARLTEALRVVLGDPRAATEAYALESGSCARCGRHLTVPASLHRGLGPECAAKWGVA